MPRELTGAEEVAYNQYLALGTPDQIQRTIRKLKSENAERRTTNAELEQKLKDSEVPEGAVVLKKDEAAKWEEYKALGEPSEIKAKAQKADELQARVEKNEREKAIREAAEAAGYKPTVLTDLADAKGLQFEIRDEKGEDGETRKVAFVTPEGGKPESLTAYVEQNLADYLPALTVATEQRKGTNYLPQQSSRTAGNGGYDPREEGRKMAEQKVARENSLAFK